MSIIEAVFFGILQGITEFLPVSSSGHLVVARHFFGLKDVPAVFDVVLHLPSLLAVIIFFRKKIARLFAILFRWIFRKPAVEYAADAETDLISGNDETGRRTILAVIVTTFVTGVLGVFSSKMLPELPVKAVFAGFIVTSFLLIASGMVNRAKNGKPDQTGEGKGISLKQAVVTGIAQGFGTLPGISRSGSTIAGSLFSGMDRAAAGEYSFIISIPAILGAFVLELKDFDGMASSVGAASVIAGCAACFAAAYLSLAFLMKLIKKGRLEWFAAYLIPLGLYGLIFVK